MIKVPNKTPGKLQVGMKYFDVFQIMEVVIYISLDSNIVRVH